MGLIVKDGKVICHYCFSEIASGMGPAHPECGREWRRRKDAGMCVACGAAKADQPEYDKLRCATCASTGAEYRNFPEGV